MDKGDIYDQLMSLTAEFFALLLFFPPLSATVMTSFCLTPLTLTLKMVFNMLKTSQRGC